MYMRVIGGKGHPLIQKLRELGCKEGKRDGDYETLKVIPVNDWK